MDVLHDRKTEHFKLLHKMVTPLLLQTMSVSTDLNIKWDYFEIFATGESDEHCKIKETLLISDSKTSLHDNFGSEKLFFINFYRKYQFCFSFLACHQCLALFLKLIYVVTFTLIIFYQFCDNCKISSFTYHLEEAKMKITFFAHFLEYHRNHKKIKSLYGLEGHCLKITDICIDFEPCFKVHNLVYVHPKSIKLGQMATLNVIFHVIVSVYRSVEI